MLSRLAADSPAVTEEVATPQKEEEKKKRRSHEQISKYRQLLKGIQEKEKKLQEDKDMEMEISWVPGTSRSPGSSRPAWEESNVAERFLPAGLKETTEQLVKKKLEAKEKLTPWEEYLQKKKEKKKERKSQKKQVRNNNTTFRMNIGFICLFVFVREEVRKT